MSSSENKTVIPIQREKIDRILLLKLIHYNNEWSTVDIPYLFPATAKIHAGESCVR